ncbi:MAG: hypothetical protein JW850_20360 [Thermoflexales bacterium]|nr:hypothetical protein [Thermoflexales bacterium]
MIKQVIYRTRQFFDSLRVCLGEDELHQAKVYLSPAAWLLFQRMPGADQRHGLAVMRALQRAGLTQPPLLVAALLHDVGKSAARLTPVHRTIIVLLDRFWPAAMDWLASEAGTMTRPDWRWPFIVQRRHAELGALWAQRVGCDAVSVALIRRHHEPLANPPRDEIEHLLARLQQADRTH